KTRAGGMAHIGLGLAGAQPATAEAMSYMRSLLPAGSPWFAFGISLHQFPMAAQAVLLGGHPRVGLEDNLYLEKGKLAPSNAALEEKAAKIVEVLGDIVATPADARAILGLKAVTNQAVPRARICPRADVETSLFRGLVDRTSIHRLDLDDRGAVVAADPERHRAGRVIHEHAADIGRFRQQIFDELAGLGI